MSDNTSEPLEMNFVLKHALKEIQAVDQVLADDLVRWIKGLHTGPDESHLPVVIRSLRDRIDRNPASPQTEARRLLLDHGNFLAPRVQAWGKDSNGASSAASEIVECFSGAGSDGIEAFENTVVPALQKSRPSSRWPDRFAFVVELAVTKWFPSLNSDHNYRLHTTLVKLMESRPYNKPALIRTPSFASTVLKIYIKHHNLLLAALFFWAIDADPRSREDRIVFLTEYMNPIFLEIEESVCFSNAPYADAWVLMTRRYISESTIRYREEMDEAAWQDFVEQIDILWGFVPKKADRIRLLSGAAEHKKLCER